MITLIATALVSYDWFAKPVPESLAMQCAAQVGIPYASDNFSDEEFEQFKQCVIQNYEQQLGVWH